MTKAVCEASFARSHHFVPDFLVSILPKPANFFGMNSVLLIKLLFIMHFGMVYSVLTFLSKSATTINFGSPFQFCLLLLVTVPPFFLWERGNSRACTRHNSKKLEVLPMGM